MSHQPMTLFTTPVLQRSRHCVLATQNTSTGDRREKGQPGRTLGNVALKSSVCRSPVRGMSSPSTMRRICQRSRRVSGQKSHTQASQRKNSA